MGKLSMSAGPKFELHVQLPWELAQEAVALAARMDLSMSQFVRQALREKLRAEEGK